MDHDEPPGDGPLAGIDRWPVGSVAAAVVGPGGVGVTRGPLDQVLPWASLTKLLTALALHVACEEGTVALDQPAGPPGATLAHLLAHASGLAPDDATVLADPGRRRIYSNAGFEAAAALLAGSAGMAFAAYLHEAVLVPLGMGATRLDGSPAHGASGSVADLARLAVELSAPTLVTPTTMAGMTTVAFPGLDGVLPGYGAQRPNDWGLGAEVRGTKDPHWTAPEGSPRTFGHFGRSGGFCWIDPDAGVGCVSLADRPFGPWAVQAWPSLATSVLVAGRSGGGGP